MSPTPRLVFAAAVFGFLGIALGAFGAHGLSLQGRGSVWWQTASQYHQIYAVAALLAALLGAPRAGWLFLAGTAVFSGCLYTMALTGSPWLGRIVPLGGALFLSGWAVLCFGALRGTRPAAPQGSRGE